MFDLYLVEVKSHLRFAEDVAYSVCKPNGEKSSEVIILYCRSESKTHVNMIFSRRVLMQSAMNLLVDTLQKKKTIIKIKF